MCFLLEERDFAREYVEPMLLRLRDKRPLVNRKLQVVDKTDPLDHDTPTLSSFSSVAACRYEHAHTGRWNWRTFSSRFSLSVPTTPDSGEPLPLLFFFFFAFVLMLHSHGCRWRRRLLPRQGQRRPLRMCPDRPV